MTAPIRTGIIGFGLAGSVFHGPLLAADPAELWESAGQLDLVVIATATPSHVGLADAAIQAGLNVVIDNPFAVTRADGERLIASAARAGVALTVFQNRRWDGDFLTVRRLIGEGALGAVHRFESRFEWLNPRPRPAWKTVTAGREGGGVAYDLGAHLVDQALALFGPVKEVYGEFETRRQCTRG
jgi:scyllo-inositol 2-dehydrogenase (NADP+)